MGLLLKLASPWPRVVSVLHYLRVRPTPKTNDFYEYNSKRQFIQVRRADETRILHFHKAVDSHSRELIQCQFQPRNSLFLTTFLSLLSLVVQESMDRL